MRARPCFCQPSIRQAQRLHLTGGLAVQRIAEVFDRAQNLLAVRVEVCEKVLSRV